MLNSQQETRPAASLQQKSQAAIEAVRTRDVHLHYAPVAQLDRAAASGAVGREFESLRARQFFVYALAGDLAGTQGIVRIARTLGTVGVESRPAPDAH